MINCGEADTIAAAQGLTLVGNRMEPDRESAPLRYPKQPSPGRGFLCSALRDVIKEMQRMKSLTKMLMLGVLASLALLAASSTAASAAAAAAACTTKAGSKKYELCVNGSSINETTTVGTSAHLTSTLTVTLPKNWASTITCTTMTGAPSFGVHGLAESVTLTLSAKLSGCKLNGGLTEDGCSVNSEFS